VAGGLVLVRHHANIVRLVKGTESQLKETILMHQLSKSLHVLALGMWFGMSVFFTFVVAFALFGAFEALGQTDERATWFPQPPMYADSNAAVNAPKEQGTRAAGHAIGPMFVWYFVLQGACGFVSLATALSFLKGGTVHRWRVNLLFAALACVLIGWPLERKVHELREPRNHLTELYLLDQTNQAKTDAMLAARAEFTRWHLYSVFVNLATVVCVTAAMALAGNLGSTKGTKEYEAGPPMEG
jgi:acyl phosphate:glycerol-3-phosphate acyltransferase